VGRGDKAAPLLESGLFGDDDGAFVSTECGTLPLNELVFALAGKTSYRHQSTPHSGPSSYGSATPDGVPAGTVKSFVSITWNNPSG
jgi:hypothetical protein